MGITLCQKASDVAVGRTGCLGRLADIPFTGRLMYLPLVEKVIVEAPRCEVTVIVIFA